eukprot:COSAG03_NODE_1372_length_4223_cov_2.796314_3_plen_84_part_00
MRKYNAWHTAVSSAVLLVVSMAPMKLLIKRLVDPPNVPRELGCHKAVALEYASSSYDRIHLSLTQLAHLASQMPDDAQGLGEA